MFKRRVLFAIVFVLILSQLLAMVVSAEIDPTKWVSVDGLGRELPTNKEVGGIKQGKYVGIFYWTWHYNFISNTPHNVTEIMKEHPEIKNDFNHDLWRKKYYATSYFWNEPIYGYYTSTDKYVLRKQAEMLDAGIDFVAFDCTNGSFYWEPAYLALCEVLV